MIIIHATMHVNPEKTETFLQEIQPLIEASRAEAGNISYNLYQSAEKENTFLMAEVWKSPDAVASHNQSDHFKAFTAKAQEFLSAPLQVDLYQGEPLQTSR
ncbi:MULTISPECIES: putative quinol monooxygenase [Brevibacillus]|jgi:quinol monooxygenase YgiN|uniref:putative quinol monooxygenase n=1 Tax=Brevibacillus TaxID=55080 RepID=UPI0009DCBC01|nr:putative quinol monooxygenase [Brevibacillus borstelensis]MBE5396584.1 antibiotic biosynthesis monooxygenase [Brevibacillus borstelensis]MCC0566797.1 antibiotic biosynthesis monooxygenase [Brevibacillus borstelensis]MED1745914.1 putative quinol monooxygenase [Brevibacillus borstelensis]MED1876476.1 putative quinol monooxygenase [Brevibacillus borstelensis]MED1883200.1 putative quinol monooxygenase [Brevibacillus borstelensis]